MVRAEVEDVLDDMRGWQGGWEGSGGLIEAGEEVG